MEKQELKHAYYLNRLNTAMNRMESHHHAWYLLQASLTLAYCIFVISLATSLFKMNNELSYLVILLTMGSFLFFDFLITYNSVRFVWMARTFREIEGWFLRGDVEDKNKHAGAFTLNASKALQLLPNESGDDYNQRMNYYRSEIVKLGFTELIQTLFSSAIVIISLILSVVLATGLIPYLIILLVTIAIVLIYTLLFKYFRKRFISNNIDKHLENK